VTFLITSKANVNIQDGNEDTRKLSYKNKALHKAAWKDHQTTAELLIEAACDLNILNKQKKRAVDIATGTKTKSFLESFDGEENKDEGEDSD
jgi:ankyrin repeat protein